MTAVKGQGAAGVRRSLETGVESALPLIPSSSKKFQYGFSTFQSLFPPCEGCYYRDGISIEPAARVARRHGFLFRGSVYFQRRPTGRTHVGHDRSSATFARGLSRVCPRGRKPLLCTHPYDVCTELIAREAGVIVTDTTGAKLNAPRTPQPMWHGSVYANEHCAG